MAMKGKTMDLLAVGAHPDDVELTCGGTVALLAKEYEVGILDLTEGEAGTRGTVEERRAEAKLAAEILGVSVRKNCCLPDSGVSSASRDQLAVVVDALRELKPRVILAPHWEAVHPDHAECSKLIQSAYVLVHLRHFKTDHPAYRPQGLFFYDARSGMVPSFVVDISSVFDVKMEAIRAHRSQFEPDPDPAKPPLTEISDPTFLEGIGGMARFWGFRARVRYGEPFMSKEPFRVADPLAAFFPKSAP
jgi:bacillithiol biosynthesis deacetylase BshB1